MLCMVGQAEHNITLEGCWVVCIQLFAVRAGKALPGTFELCHAQMGCVNTPVTGWLAALQLYGQHPIARASGTSAVVGMLLERRGIASSVTTEINDTTTPEMPMPSDMLCGGFASSSVAALISSQA